MADRDLFGSRPATIAPDGVQGQEERGAFFTPDSLALAITSRVDTLVETPERIFEPGCGGGAFLRACHATWPKAQLLGVDLVPACTGPGIVRTLDLFDVAMPLGAFDLVIGNPDFSIAERVVRRGLELVGQGGHVAMLLRLGFIASQERMALFAEHPLFAFGSIPERPSFTGSGTDRYDYALFLWSRGHRGEGRLLSPVRWR